MYVLNFCLDEEIDNILQQMGRLLSPAGQEFDNKIYKHVIGTIIRRRLRFKFCESCFYFAIHITEETENKSIEQILTEAKELINDSIITDGASICLSTDDLSSVSSANDVTFINIDDSNDTDDLNGNYNTKDNKITILSQESPKLNNRSIKNGRSCNEN